jgi:phospholipid/cholesterol/gamma-HCH transport system permease protein
MDTMFFWAKSGLVLRPMSEANPEPTIACTLQDQIVTAALAGDWTVNHAATVEKLIDNLPAEVAAQDGRRLVLDMGQIAKLDTMGALVIGRLRRDAGSDGIHVEHRNASQPHAILLDEVGKAKPEAVVPNRPHGPMDILVDIGEVVVNIGRDLVRGTSFLGEVVVATGKALTHPGQFRGPSLVNQIEQIAFRGAPIIMLISFLVGCIVAQQGIFQLQRFGATPFVVNLVGILILRELAVLLTSIMVAGRSGSAFTAEIGSMKMREEIDALRVMGLDPVAVLVVPRILALLIALPLLTFISSLAGLIGAGLVSWIYGGITPETFLVRLQGVITAKHFSVGLIKAPFMALMIGLIASLEGLAVKGSAESLGKQVTSSVVKAIFMVIVVDGLFAMFFAAIKY